MYTRSVGTPAEEKPCAGNTASAHSIAGLGMLAVVLSIAWYAWPSEIIDVPLDALTLGVLYQAVYAACLALVALLIAKRVLH